MKNLTDQIKALEITDKTFLILKTDHHINREIIDITLSRIEKSTGIRPPIVVLRHEGTMLGASKEQLIRVRDEINTHLTECYGVPA